MTSFRLPWHPERLRPALRNGLAVLTAALLANHFGLIASYWVPLTTAVVMLPTGSATLGRAFARVGGTLIGVIIGALTIYYSGGITQLYLIMLAMLFLSFFGLSIITKNYSFFVAMITTTVVIMIDLTNSTSMPVEKLMLARIYDTLLGSLVAIIFSLLILPIKQKDVLHNCLNLQKKASSDYLQAIIQQLLVPDQVNPSLGLCQAQLEASLFNSRLEMYNWRWQLWLYPQLKQQVWHKILLAENLTEHLFSLANIVPTELSENSQDLLLKLLLNLAKLIDSNRKDTEYNINQLKGIILESTDISLETANHEIQNIIDIIRSQKALD